MDKLKILVGCEESQAVTTELRKLGHEAFSCDTQECSGGHPEWHLQMDVFDAIDLNEWDIGIFFPDCTYLTCSAEWTYKEGPYHQNVKAGTLTGYSRSVARDKAVDFVVRLYTSKIPKVAIENPVGVLSRRFKKYNLIIQPYEFGSDASKKTCLWLKNLPELTVDPLDYIEPRFVDGKPRWSNQTDSGQNKLPPSPDRAKLRSKTYPGIAKAMAEQWTEEVTDEQ
jgi:hypothetical protein